MNKHLDITQMSELFQNVTIIKFMSYLDIALAMQTNSMGPNKRGLYFLLRELTNARAQAK